MQSQARDNGDQQDAASSTATAGPSSSSARTATPPDKLPSSVSMQEFKGWRASWRDYETLAELSKLSVRHQLAKLRSCLTADMRATLEHAIGIDSENSNHTVASVLDGIESYIRQQRDVALDRVKFEERKQEKGESFDAFLVALKQIADDADFCGECIDQRLTTRIMSGVRDTATRKRLLAIRPFPSLEMAVDVCRSDENGKTNEAALTSTHRQFNQVRKRPRSPTPAPTSTRYNADGQPHTAPKRWRSPTPPCVDKTCGRCGGAWHAARNDCPAFDKSCLRCGPRGHFSRLCRTRESGTFRRHSRFSNDRRRHQRISKFRCVQHPKLVPSTLHHAR